MKKIIFQGTMFALCTAATPLALCEPVHIDVDGAHVIVIRPIDTWAGNRTTAEYSIDGFKRKNVSFFYVDSTGTRVFGSNGLFNSVKPGSLAHDVQSQLAQLGYTSKADAGQAFTVERPATVAASEMPAIMAAQDAFFKDTIIKQGNPAMLADRIRDKKWATTLFSVALFGAGINKFGAADGINKSFATGLSEDFARLTLNGRLALAAVPAASFDYTQYRSVDIRKVAPDQPDRVGQIIIAYKGDKTPEVERMALAKAIVTAGGADTTIEAIESARAQDLASRQIIWDNCVTSGQCKND